MTGYEIIKRNVEFKNPDRIGIRFDRIAGEGDVYRIFVQPAKEFRKDKFVANVAKKAIPIPNERDEWGCLWASESAAGAEIGQVVDNPIKDWEQFDDFVFPDPYAEGRFDGLEKALDEAEKKGLYVQLNSPHCMFERMHFLRGFENLLMDCMLEQENVEKLADKLVEYQIGIIRQAYKLGKGRIHCFDTTDDWGSQNNLLIPPDIFRSIFKPRYKKIVEAAHECGMHVRFHTDGKINEILEDFIEIGFDILNIHQPRLMGIDEVSKVARGRICFEAAVDVQDTLPKGNKEAIRAEAKELCEKWATPNGGLIAVEYGYLDAAGIKRESMLEALDAFKEYGQLKK